MFRLTHNGKAIKSFEKVEDGWAYIKSMPFIMYDQVILRDEDGQRVITLTFGDIGKMEGKE